MSDESTYPEPSDPSDPTSPSEPTDPPPPPPPDPDDEEYIPIEVVPPPEPVPPGDGFTFGVVVAPAPPPPSGASASGASAAAVAAAAVAATTLDVDVFLIGAESGVPTVTPLDNAEIRRYFEYLDRKLKFKNPNMKEGIGRTAEHAPAGSLLLVVTNKSLNTASAGVVNISG